MLRWASSMGLLHRKGTDAFQLLRYFGSESGMSDTSGGVGKGVLSDETVSEVGGFVTSAVLPSSNTWVVQAMLKFSNTLSGTPSAGVDFLAGGSTQCRVTVEPAPASGARGEGELYRLTLRRGATILASTNYEFYARQWTAFQIKVTVDTGTGGSIEIRAARRENESFLALSTVLTQASLNTADTAAAGADQIKLDYSANTAAQWDHVTVFDATGSLNNDFPGKLLLVQGVKPTGNGAFQEWSSKGGQGSGYQTLDDPAFTIAEDVGRLTSKTVGEKFLVGMPAPAGANPIGSASNVLGVIVQHVSGMENSGTRTVAPLYRNSAAATAQGANVVLSDTSLRGYFQVFEQDPVSSVDWTAQGVTDMQWGLILVS